MNDGCSKPGQQIVDQKALASPYVFYGRTKHPNREHIKEDVRDAAMHKHVADDLKYVEFLALENSEGQEDH